MTENRKVKKSYKFRAYCNKTTEKTLEEVLECCRWEYNLALSLKEITYNLSKESLHKYSIINNINHFTALNPFLGKVYSQVRQEVISRLDHNYSLFFKGVKEGRKVGKPRFIPYGQYCSFTYQDPKRGFKLSKRDKTGKKAIGNWRWLKLSLADKQYIYLKIKKHRAVKGKLKTLTVKKNSLGEWYIIVVTDHIVDVKPKTSSIGIDLGIKDLATTSKNTVVENPLNSKNPSFIEFEKTFDRIVDCQRSLQIANDKLKKAHNIKDKKEKKLELEKWYRIKKYRLKSLRLAWKIYNNLKHEYMHQEARSIVNESNVICIEDFKPKKLSEKNFTKKKSLRKRLRQASCTSFKTVLFSKALINGNIPVLVPPFNTTKTCSDCGSLKMMKLEDRIYECKKCKLIIDRDYNAAINIEKLGLELLKAA